MSDYVPLEIFTQNDRLGNFLVSKLEFTPRKTGLLALLFAILLSISTSIASGVFNAKAGYIGLENDYFYWISEVILIPAFWGYYIWAFREPHKVINSLVESNVIEKGKLTSLNIAQYLNYTKINILSIAISVLIGIIYLIDAMGVPTIWLSSLLVIIPRVLLVIIPTGFVTSSFALRLIQNARLFRNILSGANLHPLHPDKAGGLKPLGTYALKTTYLIGLAGSIVVAGGYISFLRGTFSQSYFFQIALLSYFLIAPISFFSPLKGAHDAMHKAKKDFLLKISQQFNNDYLEAQSIIHEPGDDLEENIDKIEHLQKLHKLTSEFPVWPYDFATIRNFAFTITSPFVTLLGLMIVNLVTEAILR
jgi:hypothetical protein